MGIPILSNLWEKIVDKGGDIISEIVTDKDLAKNLDHAFRTQMAANAHEFQTLQLQAEQAMFEAQQQTIQAELHQTDLYTKQTRPKIARQSWYVTAAYAIGTTFLPMMPAEWGLQVPVIQWEIFLVLASPALTYMGVRGFEKWKGGGAK
jgi:Holin of 3TMs, for gene-transfer release